MDVFLQHSARMGSVTGIEVIDATVRRFDGAAIVSCLQEMHVAYLPDSAPLVIHAAVTRVWVPDGAGWTLAHRQLARRQPPG